MGGYKLHIDAADGGVPLSCILTSASLHDSQVAIPLATLTAARVTNLYDLMDSAYDAPEIRAHSESLGHVAIIDANPRSASRKLERKTAARAQRAVGHVYAEVATVSAPPSRMVVSRTSSAVAKPRARSRQGAVPPDVRHGGADGVAVDAPVELKPTSFHPSPLGVLSRQGHAGQVCSYTAKETSLSLDLWPLPEKCCRCPDDVSDAETSPGAPVQYQIRILRSRRSVQGFASGS